MSIELPKDAEGREIPFDTKVLYDRCGNEYEVSRYCCSVRQSIPERVWEAVVLDTVTYYTSRLYLTPPDSWEKLEEDLDRCIEESDLCMYYNNQNPDCNKCTISGNESRGCTSVALEDIKRRIRNLRGEGE